MLPSYVTVYNMHQDTKSARLIAVCKRIPLKISKIYWNHWLKSVVVVHSCPTAIRHYIDKPWWTLKAYSSKTMLQRSPDLRLQNLFIFRLVSELRLFAAPCVYIWCNLAKSLHLRCLSCTYIPKHAKLERLMVLVCVILSFEHMHGEFTLETMSYKEVRIWADIDQKVHACHWGTVEKRNWI